jgi:hypothetical protein
VTELERKHLVETDRHIAECKNYIAKQRELIERAIKQGRSTEVADIMLETLAHSDQIADMPDRQLRANRRPEQVQQ